MSIFTRHRRLQMVERDKIVKDYRRKDWPVLANAAVMVQTCQEVWAYVGEPPELDPDGLALVATESDRWPLGLDGDLADVLGLVDPGDGTSPAPIEVMRKLYLVDGAVQQAARTLAHWSRVPVIS